MSAQSEIRQFLRQQQTRRTFLGRAAQGVGKAALASLLSPTLWAAANVWQDALRSIENRAPMRGHRAQLRAKGGAIREVLVFPFVPVKWIEG